jgi:hypothetical protein
MVRMQRTAATAARVAEHDAKGAASTQRHLNAQACASGTPGPREQERDARRRSPRRNSRPVLNAWTHIARQLVPELVQ